MAGRQRAQRAADAQEAADTAEWNGENEATVAAATPALTEAQLAGIDPVDPERDEEQAEERDELANQQTDHEAENALDPVSRAPTPALAAEAFVEGERLEDGQIPTDMSGRAPVPMDKGEEAFDISMREAMKALRKAKKEDAPNLDGWRNAQELQVSRRALDELVEEGKLETEYAVGGQFFPETGKRYRIPK